MPLKSNSAFQQWFGDSKVIDAAGNPLVVYYGTGADFTEFRFSTIGGDLGIHFGTQDQANIRMDGNESARVMSVYLSLKNPLRLRDNGNFFMEEVYDQLKKKRIKTSRENSMQSLRKAIENAGHDGVVYLNRREIPDVFDPYGDETEGLTDAQVRTQYPQARDSFIAFTPGQIKSATGNNGDYDTANSDIRFSLADQDEPSSQEAPCP